MLYLREKLTDMHALLITITTYGEVWFSIWVWQMFHYRFVDEPNNTCIPYMTMCLDPCASRFCIFYFLFCKYIHCMCAFWESKLDSSCVCFLYEMGLCFFCTFPRLLQGLETGTFTMVKSFACPSGSVVCSPTHDTQKVKFKWVLNGYYPLSNH